MSNSDKRPIVTETPAERFERVVKTVESRQKRAKERRRRTAELQRDLLDKKAATIP